MIFFIALLLWGSNSFVLSQMSGARSLDRPFSGKERKSRYQGSGAIHHSLRNSYAKVHGGSGVAHRVFSAFQHGSGALHHGSTPIKHGSSALHHSSGAVHGGSGTLKHGSTPLHGGSGTLKHGSGARHYGSTPVHHGSIAFHRGSSALHSGSSALHSGSNVVHDGSSAVHRGSGPVKHGSGARYRGSSELNQGSTALHYGSTRRHYGSGPVNYGSTQSHHGSAQVNYGSTALHRGSTALHHGSTARERKSSSIRQFTPTLEPTEGLPPAFQPPNPTMFPTRNFNIFKFQPTEPDGHEVPEIPITFQIKQGASGWATFPDDPPVEQAFTKAVIRSTDITNIKISNLMVTHANKNRQLLSGISIKYNITTSSKNDPKQTYDIMAQNLKMSVKTRAFSQYLHESGLPINITNIEIWPFVVVEPNARPIESSGSTKIDLTTFFVSVGIIVAFISVMYYFINKHSRIKKQTVDTIPNPLHS